MIWILLNLRFVLWPRWAYLVKCSVCIWAECGFYCCWSVLQISVRSDWSLLFKFTVSLLTFWLLVASIQRGVVISLTIIVYLSIFSLWFNQFLFHVFWDSVIRCIMFRIVLFSWWTNHFINVKWPSLSLVIFLALKSTLMLMPLQHSLE